MAEQDYKKYGIKKGDMVDVARFRELIHKRTMGENVYIPKAMEANFTVRAVTPEEKEIGDEIREYRKKRSSEEEEKLFGFKNRLANAERKLKEKPTKTTQKEKEVCERQVERTKVKLAKLSNDDLTSEDSRIFPLGWAPMMIMKNGHRVVVPTRYHLRPQGQKPEFDRKYDGNYNARRENLEKVAWWKNIFGKNHGVMLIHKFYENIPRHKFEKRQLHPGEKETNVVLEFTPSDNKPMYVAVIYDIWPDSKTPEFYSAAAITMDPPPEIAETGHERCIVPIPEELVDSWLEGGKPLQAYYAILDQRKMPFYRHRLAA